MRADAKKQINKMVDRIADEVVELAANSGKIADILIEMDQNKETMGQILEENKKLRERIIRLEKRLEGRVTDFKADVTEVDRAISERWQQFEDERNQDIMGLINQIQSLRDNLIKTRMELKRLMESGMVR